jgi:erythronate-4-phosphate dehydrogenase
MPIKIVADDKIPFLQGVLEPYLDIEYLPGNTISNENIKDADGLILRTRTRCNNTLLDGTSVKFIATATIGYDHIDTQYCKKKNIVWANAPGCNSGSVMQYMASALLYYARVRQIDLTDRVIGIVGVGNVGKKVLKLAETLDMHIVLNDPPRERAEGKCGFLSLDGITREADIITLHVPLNMSGKDMTYHLADSDFFKRLNPGTLFINASRGEVVDTGSLKMFLKKGSQESAIIDVWENEPVIDHELSDRVFLATPHIAGYSTDGKANGTKMAVQALSRFFELGLDEWEPDRMPEPSGPVLYCDGLNKSFQDILTELVFKTYDIASEDAWLKTDTTKFEFYRGNYPVRREFSAYYVEGTSLDEDIKRKLRKLGFKVNGR